MADIYAGMWDFDGSCAPAENDVNLGRWSGQETFTLGCFQWQAKSRGKDLKKGKVFYRINGRTSDPKPAYERARAYCAKKNAEAAQ